MKRLFVGVAVLGSVLAISSAAAAANLINNGGFEGGVTTVGANTNVPVDWTPNAASEADVSYFRVVGADAHSGSFSLEIGNFDRDPVDAIGQTFTDVSGATYTASYFAYASAGGDGNAFLTVSIDGTPFSTLNDTLNGYSTSPFTFSFTGTGSDTLTIAAKTNPGDWYVDDVSVVANAVNAVPEPGSWALLIVGGAMLGGVLRGRRRSEVSLTSA